MKYSYFLIFICGALLGGCTSARMGSVHVAADQRGFVIAPFNKPFIPWGHNYAVNTEGAEEEMDWVRIARDFDDFRAMHANVARVHLQVPRYMDGPCKPNALALAELRRLLKLAERKGIYLDVTGLASYDIRERAKWYDALDEKERWSAQACFWEAVAEACSHSRAVFCYDLMNEPVVGGKRKDGWYAGRMGNYEFVQRLSFNEQKLPPSDIASEWTQLMVSAIHKHDRNHLITIGMLPAWGPSPKVVGPQLDFISVHIYPEAGRVSQAIEHLRQFDIGKPLVVEETFPLSCGVKDERNFLLQSRGIATGWIGQYPSETPEELSALQRSGKITAAQAAYLAWIELFREVGP